LTCERGDASQMRDSAIGSWPYPQISYFIHHFHRCTAIGKPILSGFQLQLNFWLERGNTRADWVAPTPYYHELNSRAGNPCVPARNAPITAALSLGARPDTSAWQ